MNNIKFTQLIITILNKEGYKNIKCIRGSSFNISCSKNNNNFAVVCYHKSKLPAVENFSRVSVILFTDYDLEEYEIKELNKSDWLIIDRNKLFNLLNKDL